MLCPKCNCYMEEYVGLSKVEWTCANQYCGNSPAIFGPAKGYQLDNMAMREGITRRIGETDDELRVRIKQSIPRPL